MKRGRLRLRLALPGAALAAAFLASGCAAPVKAPADAPPLIAGAPPGGAQRVVVIAVANPRAALPTQAGTTPGLYEATPAYAVGVAARRLLDTIAREHRLTALAGWPIPALGMYCGTFLIPADMTREQALAELAKDPRIAIAQPLNQFETLVRDPARAPGLGGPEDDLLARPLRRPIRARRRTSRFRCNRFKQ